MTGTELTDELLSGRPGVVVQRQPACRTARRGVRPLGRGVAKTFEHMADALSGAWMVIEAVPESVELKTEVFGELDRSSVHDALLCSNSSSLPSRLFIDKVSRPQRVLNTHYQRPPEKY